MIIVFNKKILVVFIKIIIVIIFKILFKIVKINVFNFKNYCVLMQIKICIVDILNVIFCGLKFYENFIVNKYKKLNFIIFIDLIVI